VEHSDDRGELVLEAGRGARLSKGKASIFECLEHAERFVEAENDGCGNWVVFARLRRAHQLSLAATSDVVDVAGTVRFRALRVP
jgi:hypothetical protein